LLESGGGEIEAEIGFRAPHFRMNQSSPVCVIPQGSNIDNAYLAPVHLNQATCLQAAQSSRHNFTDRAYAACNLCMGQGQRETHCRGSTLPIIATLIQQELRNAPVHVSQREALDQRSAFPHTAGEQPQRGQTDFRPFETEPHNLLAWQEQYERILFRRGGGRIGSTVKNGDFRERRAGPLDMYDLLPSVRADAICPYGSLHYDVESGSGFAGEE